MGSVTVTPWCRLINLFVAPLLLLLLLALVSRISRISNISNISNTARVWHSAVTNHTFHTLLADPNAARCCTFNDSRYQLSITRHTLLSQPAALCCSSLSPLISPYRSTTPYRSPPV